MKTLRFTGMLLIIVNASCINYTINIPDDFVVYDREAHFKAITADGIRMKIKKIKNEPKGDILLWSRTIELHLKSRGYQIIKNDEIKTVSGLQGRAMLSLFKYHRKDYSYLTAIFVHKKYVYLIESAGPYDIFNNHQKNIYKSIRSFRIKYF